MYKGFLLFQIVMPTSIFNIKHSLRYKVMLGIFLLIKNIRIVEIIMNDMRLYMC